MARVFSITAAATSLRADAQGRAECPFTVSNTSGRPLRGRAEVKAADPAQQGWFSLVGELERSYAAGGTDQVSVRIAVPPGSPAGKYSFRLDVVSAQNPDEDFAEGPTVSLEAGASVAKKKPFPWWIVAVAVLLVVGGGIGLYFWLRPKEAVEVKVPPVSVPNIVGMQLEEAKFTLSKVGLKPGPATSRLTEGGTTGKVLSQNPAAGGAVAPGTEVQIEAAQAGAKIPDVVGKSGDEAKQMITGASLRVGGPFLLEAKSAAEDGKVQQQRPAAGTLVAVNTPVDIYVTMLIIKGIRVPKVVDSDRGAAEAAIKGAGLLLGKVEVQLTEDANKVGRVMVQHPPEGAVVSQDSGVDIVVGDAGVKVPSLVGQNPGDAINMIQRARLRPAPQERVDPGSGTNRVTSQDPPADGRLVKLGATVSLIYNPAAVGVDAAGRFWRWAGSGWRQLTLWGVDSSRHIWRWTGATWQAMPGSLQHVSVSMDGTVVGVSAPQIYRWTGAAWAEMPRALQKRNPRLTNPLVFAVEQQVLATAGLSQISPGSGADFWGVGSSSRIYHSTGSAWDLVDGGLKHVSVGADGTVWGVNNADQIFRWTGSTWQTIPGGLRQISVGNAQNVWGVNSASQVFRWTGTTWQLLPGGLTYVSVSAQGMAVGVNSASQIFLWTGSDWYRLPGGLVQISGF